MSRKLDVGAALSRVFALYREQAAVLLPAAAVVFLVPALVALLAVGRPGLVVVALVVALVATFWYQGVVVAAVQDMEDGRRDFSIGELFSSVGPFVGPLVGAGILAGIGVAVGLVLFIVPGLILLTLWALIAPVIVLERARVMQSFGRSRELVRGNGWQVFAIIVLLAIVQAVVSELFQGIASSISGARGVHALGSYVGNVLVAPLGAIAATVVYLRLREAKVWEGSGTAPTDFAPPAPPTPASRAQPAPQPTQPDSAPSPDRPDSIPPPGHE